jgi:hypothetical protein
MPATRMISEGFAAKLRGAVMRWFPRGGADLSHQVLNDRILTDIGLPRCMLVAGLAAPDLAI